MAFIFHTSGEQKMFRSIPRNDERCAQHGANGFSGGGNDTFFACVESLQAPNLPDTRLYIGSKPVFHLVKNQITAIDFDEGSADRQPGISIREYCRTRTRHNKQVFVDLLRFFGDGGYLEFAIQIVGIGSVDRLTRMKDGPGPVGRNRYRLNHFDRGDGRNPRPLPRLASVEPHRRCQQTDDNGQLQGIRLDAC